MNSALGLSAKRTAISTLTCYFLASVFIFTIGLTVPGLKNDFNLTAAEVGAMVSAFNMASAMTLAFAGYASDRFGRLVILLLGSFLYFGAILITAIADSYLILIASFFFAGFGGSFIPPAAYTIMGSLNPKSRGFMIGVTASFFSWAGLIGSPIMSLAISQFGWRMSLILISVSGLIWTSLAWLILREMLSKRIHTSRSTKESYLEMVKSKTVILISTVMFCRGLTTTSFMTWTPAFLNTIMDLDITQAGLILGVFSAAGGISTILIGHFADRLGEKILLFITMVCSSLMGWLFFAKADTLTLLLIVVSLFGFALFPTWSLGTSLAQRIVDRRLSGSITGIVQGMVLLGGVVGPLLAGMMIDIYHIQYAMILSISIPLLVGGILVVATKTRY